MKMELVRYTCASCASMFDAPEIGSDSYGEFLLRSPSGAVLYLDALQDTTYEEVDQLLATHEKTRSLSAFERAKVLRRIYGIVACDKDVDGNSFVIGEHPFCPVCGGREMASWEFKEPPELVDISVMPVTHNSWRFLSESHKQRLLEQSLLD